MNTIRFFIALAVAAQVGDGERRYADQDGNPEISDCFVLLKDEVEIPAQEAGMLTKVPVREGSRISAGDVLATIDDREVKMALRIADHAFDAAKRRAVDKIEEIYAEKAAEVARTDWEKSMEANRQTPDAVPDIDVRQKKLTYERSNLQIEKAGKDRQLAILDAKTKQAELDAAELALEMRTITAPFDGEVVEMFLNQSEWVNPGDSILKLVRFDVLYVGGFVEAELYDREELQGRPVTVRVPRARGREVSVQGRITYVSPEVIGEQYTVRAEVKNQPVGNSWVILPGLKPTMTIQLDSETRAQSQLLEKTRR